MLWILDDVPKGLWWLRHNDCSTAWWSTEMKSWEYSRPNGLATGRAVPGLSRLGWDTTDGRGVAGELGEARGCLEILTKIMKLLEGSRGCSCKSSRVHSWCKYTSTDRIPSYYNVKKTTLQFVKTLCHGYAYCLTVTHFHPQACFCVDTHQSTCVILYILPVAGYILGWYTDSTKLALFCCITAARLKDLWSVFYVSTLQNRGSIITVMLMAMLVLWMMHQAPNIAETVLRHLRRWFCCLQKGVKEHFIIQAVIFLGCSLGWTFCGGGGGNEPCHDSCVVESIFQHAPFFVS